MPQPAQHTASDAVPQVQASADQCWDELVKQRLPANLESQARAGLNCLGVAARVAALAT